MAGKDHWETIYRSRPPDEVSWYEARPAVSLELIAASGVARDAPIIDVGGGASTLVDHLLDAGYERLSVLDLSHAALEHARRRLGARAARVTWIEADVLDLAPAQRYALWHDRALFHFLTDAGERARYTAVLERALMPGGQAIIAGFAQDGPKRCSGLDTHALGRDSLGERFDVLGERVETHRTPRGAEQRFLYLRLAARTFGAGAGSASAQRSRGA